MRIIKIYTLHGPNVWSRSPVLEAWVDLEELKEAPSDSVAGFNDRLMSWLPTMIEHRCSIGERGGFFERLRRGTYPAHIMEHVTLELSTLAGSDVGFGRARETNVEGIFKVAVKFEEESLGRMCLREGLDLVLAAYYDRPYDVQDTIKRLKEHANLVLFGPSTGAIVRAARSRGIPVRRLDSGSLVQLGYGAKQHRIRMAETDKTSAIAEAIAQDKDVTKHMLRQVGLPVPEGRVVDGPDDAWQAAQDIGVPVVVKPTNANHGRGVTINLCTKEQIMKAYHVALPEGDGVMVEQFAVGGEHRLLVVDGKMVAASKGEPEQVTGDGTHTIRQLVDELNADPRRGDDWASLLCKVEIDAVAVLMLEAQGYTPDSVPDEGTTVLIHHNGELLTDVTDEVHPECAQAAVLAARIVGLDIAGIDMIARDISQPLREQRGMIVEVNAGPGLRMHLEPQHGKPRPVAEAIVATLFDEGETGRIPIVSITGTNGKTIVTQLIAHGLREVHDCLGVATSDGIQVGEHWLAEGECTGPKSARAVLLHPDVDAAVLETSRGGILRGGLGFDQCDVAVVTNIGEGDRVGQHDIESAERMVFVKRSVVDVVAPHVGVAVLNAQDALVASMAQYSRGLVTFFADNADEPLIVEHRAAGKRAVIVKDGQIVLADGAVETVLMSLAQIPATFAGRVRFQVQNVLAAVGALWALDVPQAKIVAGLESFQIEPERTGGRLNIVERDGATLLLDHCHNVSALRALIAALEVIPHQRRTVVYSAPGDRRNLDLVQQGELLGANFDRVIVYDHDDSHDRPVGEIPLLIKQGLDRGGRVHEVIEAENFEQGLRAAWTGRTAGELIVVQTGVVTSALDTALTVFNLRQGVNVV